MFNEVSSFIRSLYQQPDGFIALHEPRFYGREKEYLIDCIDTTFVSSTGPYVDKVGEEIRRITGAAYAIPIVNGTSALHLALVAAGVQRNDEVLTQALTFVATSNAIAYLGAIPHFVDVDTETLGMSAVLLRNHLNAVAELKHGVCYNKKTGRRIAACVPMHTFGIPLQIQALADLCKEYNILLIEDAAESLGSTYNGKHTGRFGIMGTLSFNGNKIVTSGGGGAIITDDPELGVRLKHLSTQAKIPHPYEYNHDQLGYNYRMPNINAALACAQLEQLDYFLSDKRQIALAYHAFFTSSTEIKPISEPQNTRSNYWLNAILLKDLKQRNEFLEHMTAKNIMVRPIWNLMNHLEMYKSMPAANLENSEYLAARIVNIPSSARPRE